MSTPRCGTCVHSQAVPTNLEFIVCYGVPPVPVVMPVQMANGQMSAGVQLVRPNIPRTERGCSLHIPKALGSVDGTDV